MREKIKAAIPFILIPIIIIVTILIFFNLNFAPPNLPLAVFAVACTTLLASLALPSLLGISDSKIIKGFFFRLYKDYFVHSLFPLFQVLLAVVALIAEFSRAEGDIPTFTSRLLLVLMIFDLFYILFYLYYFIHVISSPGAMLEIFKERIVKKIKKGKQEDVLAEIRMLGEISKDTGVGKEKTAAVEVIERLLTEVTSPPSEGEDTTLQLKCQLWALLVKYAYEVCQTDSDGYSANKKNLADAIKVLRKAWQLVNRLEQITFDYAVCRRKLAELGHFAIKKSDYRNTIEVVEGLGEIGMQCLLDQPPRRIAPSDIALDMVELGIHAVKAGKDDLADQLILSLRDFYNTAEDGQEIYLIYALNLMAFVLDNNRFAIEDLSRRIGEIDKAMIAEALEFSSDYLPRETARIKWFLKKVDEYNKSRSLPLSEEKR